MVHERSIFCRITPQNKKCTAKLERDNGQGPPKGEGLLRDNGKENGNYYRVQG